MQNLNLHSCDGKTSGVQGAEAMPRRAVGMFVSVQRVQRSDLGRMQYMNPSGYGCSLRAPRQRSSRGASVARIHGGWTLLTSDLRQESLWERF